MRLNQKQRQTSSAVRLFVAGKTYKENSAFAIIRLSKRNCFFFPSFFLLNRKIQHYGLCCEADERIDQILKSVCY